MTELRCEDYVIPAAEIGAENPLPMFRQPKENMTVAIDPSVAQEDRKHLGWQTSYRVLPYRLQDGYNRERKPRVFKACVLENEFLRATILPEVGGRLASLYHKQKKRELVECNPVFQPANLALRNAWFSGGIEWNTCQLGHYFLTCSPVFAARIRGTQGEPALRIYEWDRVKCFAWQIDFHLPPGSPFLFTRARIVNPSDAEIAMYWWTNMAVPELPGTRVLCPADTALHSANAIQIEQIPLPMQNGVDVSYATQLPSAREYFFQIPDGHRRWEAALNADGSGLVHASTARLKGRKVFYWGMHAGGRRWQEYLSVPGRAYLEIQAGLARTQLESIPMPANSAWSWTEAFGLLEADAVKVHAPEWNVAWRAAEAALEKTLTQNQIDAFDAAAEACTVRAPEEIISRGSGWGALERRRLAAQKKTDRIPAELPFGEPDAAQKPWLALLESGTLPECSPDDGPGEYMVQPEWEELLAKSVGTARGNHWLAQLHLGVMRMERGDGEGARKAWTLAAQQKPNAWALRNLSVWRSRQTHGEIVARPGVPEAANADACELLQQAWDAGPKSAALAIEYATMLLQLNRTAELQAFCQKVPAEIRANERMDILAAFAALRSGDLEAAARVFDREFATIREGEVTLTDIWFEYHARKIAAAENITLDESLRRRVKREFPPPQRIDFRVINEVV
jgi:hypothetical protein